MRGTVSVNNCNLHLTGKIGGPGVSGGTRDYNKLLNRPTINGVELSGDMSIQDLIDPDTGLGLKINNIPITQTTTLSDFGSVPIENVDIDRIVDDVFDDK